MWIFPWKVGSSPRRGEGSPRRRGGSPRRCGPPRRGHVHLGEPEDSECGLSGPHKRGVARLGEGKLHLGDPRLSEACVCGMFGVDLMA